MFYVFVLVLVERQQEQEASCSYNCPEQRIEKNPEASSWLQLQLKA